MSVVFLGYIGCLSVNGTHVTANNSTNNNVFLFFVSDLKIVYYNNFVQSTAFWEREIRPTPTQTSVLVQTLNNLMVRLQ